MQKFEKEYQIRSYECDKNGFLRIVALMNVLQDMADTHASKLGLGMDFCLKNNFAWFGANYHIKIYRLPKVHETIKIQTWPSAKKKLGAIRDFVVYDEANTPIVHVSSLWILIDVLRKKPLMFDQAVTGYEPLNERALETDFARLPELVHIDKSKTFQVRYDDIDFNNHVNNSVYPLWAAEVTDDVYREKHNPAEIEIAYKKECKLGDMVVVQLQQEGDVALYNIKSSAEMVTAAQVRIRWTSI